MPDQSGSYYLLVAQVSALALNTVDPNGPIKLTPEEEGLLVSIEGTVYDPANSIAVGQSQLTNQEACERFMGLEWKLDNVSKTSGLYVPVDIATGKPGRSKMVNARVDRNTLIYMTLKNLLTVGPTLSATIVCTMKRGY